LLIDIAVTAGVLPAVIATKNIPAVGWRL